MECRLAGETEVLWENLPQRHFGPSQNPTLPDPVLNPDRRGGKPTTNRLSYGAAHKITYEFCMKSVYIWNSKYDDSDFCEFLFDKFNLYLIIICIS
jgi:hypothetical protein